MLDKITPNFHRLLNVDTMPTTSSRLHALKPKQTRAEIVAERLARTNLKPAVVPSSSKTPSKAGSVAQTRRVSTATSVSNPSSRPSTSASSRKHSRRQSTTDASESEPAGANKQNRNRLTFSRNEIFEKKRPSESD
mmetsp:Transcript_35261/g.59418  ORF Transcript_35261/g.59418 Transcript_35261/m.59418 type:complete len:136 (+) Transcript_35261:131-538(+)